MDFAGAGTLDSRGNEDISSLILMSCHHCHWLRDLIRMEELKKLPREQQPLLLVDICESNTHREIRGTVMPRGRQTPKTLFASCLTWILHL